VDAIIAGASGLTGQSLLKQLIASQRYQSVTTLERRATRTPEFASHGTRGESRNPMQRIPGVSSTHRVMQVDYTALPALPPIDDAYCCLGTTIKKAGTQAAFRQVDFDAVLAVATRAREAGAKQFLVVSALGASTKSPIFYNRVKGEMEEAVATIGFDAVHIFQPSFLLGDRAEMRLGEKIGKGVFNLFAPVMLGGLRKYRSIHVDVVAAAMLKAAASGKRGVMRYESDLIQAMG
jgi:uncharacterized protein YbjT (DUF2867 family)